MDLRVDLDPRARTVLSKIDPLPTIARQLVRTGLEAVANDGREVLREQFLSGQVLRSRTGRLKDSLRYKFKSRLRIRLNAGRATGVLALLERGGTVRPKNDKVLRFRGANGEWVYAKQAKHKRRSVTRAFAKRYDPSRRKVAIAEQFVQRRIDREGLN